MQEFKKLTIEEFMKLLIKLTRENQAKANEYNQSISLISKSEQGEMDSGKRIKELRVLIQELILENKNFVSLFKELISFGKFFDENLEIVEETDNQSKENKKKEDTIIQDFELELASKNQDELNKLLERYIAEEKYEECARIKSLIEKAS